MVNQIEFKDCSLSGKSAVSQAKFAVYEAFDLWGFSCGSSPFTYPPNDLAVSLLVQALVDFLVSTNQPKKAGGV